ncbi:hypothetical protein GCM10023191_058870 [Actinoallomurus oryzae]|uniref:Lipoprotein n=2 Tax=Actinoallomurus oryzae TaxID=502180 RepID=A0ABP8QLL1_9ACTN
MLSGRDGVTVPSKVVVRVATFGGSPEQAVRPTINGMTLRMALAGLALASLLTGCGGGHGHSASSTPATSGARQGAARGNDAALWRQLAACLRRHGVPNFPDPVQDPSGSWGPPANTSKPPQSAMTACKSIANQLPGRRPAASAGDMAKLRRFAQCMRAHGVSDWPDPKADGSFDLPQRLRAGKQVFKTQLAACRQYMTGGQILVSGG